ncbi:PqiC family protein [bacterium]|nr:PqiC family protein [bacterium]MBU1958452.1 PqiC family protein [bacterium]
MKKRLLIPLFLILLLQGCSNKKRYYTLGDTSHINATQTYTKNITVEKVEIPKYLQDNTLVKQVTPYQVMLIEEANWLTPMQKRLTNVLISYLQKSLNNPNVYLYPWAMDKDTQKKVSLQIKRFIAYQDHVILEANYKIYDFNKKSYTTKLFNTKVKTLKSTESMMESMEKAYFELMEEIKSEIIKSS